MSGQQIGTVVGGAIGAYFGGPAGAQLGMAIGGFVGGVVDPTHINGPKIGDGQQQSATDGNPIAWVQGTAMIAGTIVQVSSRRQVRHKDGGKGGPVQVTYTAVQDFAILVCESSSIRDSTVSQILMVIQDGKLVYDVRSGSTMLAASYKWKSNVDFLFGDEAQLPHPTLEAITGVGNTPAYRGSCVAVFKNFDVSSAGDRIPSFAFVVAQSVTAVTPISLTDATTFFAIPNGVDSSKQDWISGGYYEATLSTGANREVKLENFEDNGACYRYVVVGLNRAISTPDHAAFTDAQVAPALAPAGVVLDTGWYSSAASSWMTNGRWLPLWSAMGLPAPTLQDLSTVFPNPSARQLIALLPAGTQSIRVIAFETGLSGRPTSRIDVHLAQSSDVLSYLGSDGRYADPSGTICLSPWTIDRSGSSTVVGADLSTVAGRLCKRGGLSSADYDASALFGTAVLGYPVARQSNAAECLMPLLQAYFGFATEYEAKLYFKFYGANAAVTVDRADLIEGNDANKGAIVNNLRNQATEFPKRVVASYMDPAQNYSVVDVSAERRAIDVIAIGDQSVQIPVVMAANDAAKAADRALKVAYATLEGTQEYSTPFAGTDVYLSLAAGEALLFQGKRYLADDMILGNGSIKFTTRYDRQSAYTSNVQAITGVAPIPPSSPYSGATTLALLNLPALRPQDTTGLYLAAASSTGDDSWRGCIVEVSYDGQTSWQIVTQITQVSVFGVVTTAEPSGGEPLTVAVNGLIDSVTTVQLAANANAFALVHVAAGTTEVGQAQTATETSPGVYDLTDVTRAALGTARVAAAMNDPFVMLDSVYFLPVDVSLSGKTLYFRTTGFGESTPDAPVAIVYAPNTSVIIDGGTFGS